MLMVVVGIEDKGSNVDGSGGNRVDGQMLTTGDGNKDEGSNVDDWWRD